MAWYDTGTLTLTQGSKVVVGAGTNFVVANLVGAGIVIGGLVYGVDSVEDATHLTLIRPWPNATASGVLYEAFPTSSLAMAVLAGVEDLLDSFGPFRGATADFEAVIASRADQVAADHADVVEMHAEVLTATGTATTAATAAAASQQAAADSESAAAASESAAAASETAAAASASAASSSQTAAAASEAAAAASQAAASSSETNAAASEATAIAKADIATNAAAAADASADAAATSETSAAGSAATANSAKAAAEAARDATFQAFTDFDDRYRGRFADDAAASAGTPPNEGDLYFNDTSGEMRLYASGQWVVAYVQGSGTYLPLIGGTLTGALTLPGNPTAAKHATTKEYVDARSGVTSVNGKTGAAVLVKGDVGLGNVDNTSDASKPVSTAQAAAIGAVATDAANDLADAVAAINAAAVEARRLSFFLNRR